MSQLRLVRIRILIAHHTKQSGTKWDSKNKNTTTLKGPLESTKFAYAFLLSFYLSVYYICIIYCILYILLLYTFSSVRKEYNNKPIPVNEYKGEKNLIYVFR